MTADFIAFAGVQDADTAWCPGTEQPVGGGAIISSSDLQVNINRSYPDSSGGWTVSISNASATSTPVTAYAICMAYSPYDHIVASATASPRPLGYSIQWGQMQKLAPYTEGEASVTCPGTSVPKPSRSAPEAELSGAFQTARPGGQRPCGAARLRAPAGPTNSPINRRVPG